MVRGAGSRDEIFDAVLQHGEAVDGLAVLVMEDVQWADDATLDLLRFLARRVAKLPVLLLVTFRDDALAPTDPLRLALGELAGQRYTRRIDLPPLTPAGVRRLAEGTSYSPDELYELTGGNPFFVVEVLSRAGYRGARLGPRRRARPRGSALRRARATLDLASLDSWRVDPHLVARARGVELATFDELVSAGLLKAEGSTLRFRHELARRAIESEVPPHHRLAGHQALLQALIDTDCDDDARTGLPRGGGRRRRRWSRATPRAPPGTPPGLGAYREVGGPVRTGPAVPTRRPAPARRALRRVRRPAGSGRQLAARGRGARVRDRAVARARRRPARGIRLSPARRRSTGDCAVARSRRLRSSDRWSSSSRWAPTPSWLAPCPLRRSSSGPGGPGGRTRMLRRAVAMADRSVTPPSRSDVLNNACLRAFLRRQDWRPEMDQALSIALDAGAEAQVGRAYANAYTFFIAQYRFAQGERYWRDGIAFCDDRDISTYATCLRGPPRDRSAGPRPVGRGGSAGGAGAGHGGEPGQPADLPGHARPGAGPTRDGPARWRCWTPASQAADRPRRGRVDRR